MGIERLGAVQTNFADTILNVAITGALVRLELGTVVPVQGQEGKQELRATPTMQVVMPIEGFVRAFGIQEQLIKKLVADGMLKAEPPSANNATESIAATEKKAKGKKNNTVSFAQRTIVTNVATP